MPYSEADLLPISALQHILFCPRQCAFIHLERLWVENQFTVRGENFHQRAHEGKTESRGRKVLAMGLDIHSFELGLAGNTDAVEIYYKDVEQKKIEKIIPIEYKVGKPKEGLCDIIQLCAQAICLEEMFNIPIYKAAMYYKKIRHREWVDINSGLRIKTEETAKMLHEMIKLKITPKPEYQARRCRNCSFFDICKPKIFSKKGSVSDFINKQIRDLLASNGD